MAFTKTVNYKEGIKLSLGYSNEITGSGTVTALFTYDASGGRIFYPRASDNLTVTLGGTDSNQLKIVGPFAEVNTFINQLEWYPRVFETSSNKQGEYNELGDTGQELAVIQPYTIGWSGKEEGEIELDLYNQVGTFAVGEIVRIQNVDVDDESNTLEYDYDFEIVHVDGTRIRLRWPGTVLGSKGWFNASGNILCSEMTVTSATSQSLPGSEIDLYQRVVKRNGEAIDASGFVVDYMFTNAIGKYTIAVDVSTGDSGVTTLIGSLFSNRPVITNVPASVDSAGNGQFTDGLDLGDVSDSDNSQVTVQLLLKRHANDPDYEWGSDYLKGRPSYITDDSYGVFSNVKIGDNTSTTDGFNGTPIRWQFYGTPAECSQALDEVRFMDTSADDPTSPCDTNTDLPTKDFFIEVRVLDGWSRTFSSRGYN